MCHYQCSQELCVPLVSLVLRRPEVFFLLRRSHGLPLFVPRAVALDKVEFGQDEKDNVSADDSNQGAVTAVAEGCKSVWRAW